MKFIQFGNLILNPLLITCIERVETIPDHPTKNRIIVVFSDQSKNQMNSCADFEKGVDDEIYANAWNDLLADLNVTAHIYPKVNISQTTPEVTQEG